MMESTIFFPERLPTVVAVMLAMSVPSIRVTVMPFLISLRSAPKASHLPFREAIFRTSPIVRLPISLAMKLSVRSAGSAKAGVVGRICTMALLVLSDDLSANAESQEGSARRMMGMKRRAFGITQV